PRQRLKCPCLFLPVFMPIVHTSNARKCVAQGALGMILIDARSAHYGSGSSAQIVQRPSGHAASFVKIAFEFGKAAYWVLAIGRKDKIPLSNPRHFVKQRQRGGGRGD